MEDLKKCDFDNCGNEEFLVWFCSHCEKYYCEKHRNDHECDCLTSSSSSCERSHSDSGNGNDMQVLGAAGSVQHLFSAIETRHVNPEADLLTGKIHANVKSSTIQNDEKMTATLGKVEQVQHVIEKTKSEKQKIIARKTKIMLLRGRAIGNEEVPLGERVYMSCFFPISSTTKCFFFSKLTTTVGSALHYIGDTQTLLAYGTPVRPDMMTLCFGTYYVTDKDNEEAMFGDSNNNNNNNNNKDSGDGNTQLLSECRWDKSALLSVYVEDDFMELGVIVMLATESVKNQNEINSEHQQQRHGKEISGDANSHESVSSAYQYKKGERVVYRNAEVGIIVGVHEEEDPPYYTIQLSGEVAGSVKEKQTVGVNLSLFVEPPLCVDQTGGPFTSSSSQQQRQGDKEGSGGGGKSEGEGVGDVFSIRLSSGGKVRRVDNVPIEGTVADLKKLISTYTGVLPSLQKLLYKGKVLKDDSAKLRNASSSLPPSTSSVKKKPFTLEDNSLVMLMTMSS